MEKEQIILPILFSQDNQKALNDALMSKTGCFAFLKTDEILPGFIPTTYADAFLEIVVGLYVVYHDLACSFWKVLLNHDFCPPGFEPGRLDKPKWHVKCIISTLRPQMVHGFFLPRDNQIGGTEEGLRVALETLFDNERNRLLPWGEAKLSWPDYMQKITEKDWKRIVGKLVKDSDDFYSLLLEWADSWEKAISAGKDSPRHDFIWSDAFAKSIDLRVLDPYCKKHGIKLERGSDQDKWLTNLQTHLQDFYDNSPHLKKPDRILKELERWLKNQNQGGSSPDIAAKFGFGLVSSKLS